MSRAIPYRKAVYANCGLKTAHITYTPTNKNALRDDEPRKLHWRTASDALLLYTEIGYHFSIGLTALMTGIALFSGIYTCIIYISGKPIAGWTATMCFLSVAFLGVFLIFSVVIKYLSIILSLLFTRQKYLIESIEKYTAN